MRPETAYTVRPNPDWPADDSSIPDHDPGGVMPAAIIPPKDLLDRANVGSGDYVYVGQLQLRNFVEYGGLQPHHRVLEVGCGIGRMATALLDCLDDRGSYEGFDVVPESVHWCQANVTPRRPS